MALLTGLAGMMVPCALAQSVVFSAPTLLGIASDSGTNQNYDGVSDRISANQRGDVFWINQPFKVSQPSLIEVPVGTTTENVLVSNLGASSNAVSVDPSGNLWVQDGIDAVLFIPLVNGTYASGLNLTTTTPPTCTLPVTSAIACLWPNINAPALGYYDQLSDIQVDANGNIYGVDYYDGVDTSYSQRDRIVEYSGTTGVPTVLVDNLPWANTSGKLAVTSSGDIYYVDGSNLYYSAAGTGTFTTISGFSGPNGISIDSGGNLYVTDVGNNRLAFVPNVGGTLNFFSLYSIYNTNANAGQPFYSAGIDGYGNVTFPAGGYGGTFWKMSVGNINFGADFSGIGASLGPQTISLIFNTAATFGHFTVTGGSGAVPFTTSGSTCSTTTPYAAGGTCSVTVGYTANAAGAQSGTLQAFSSTGTLLGEARLSAIAYAPLLNIDPGTVSAVGTSWHAPSSIAVDSTGNTYVVDSSTGGIYKNGSTTAIATGFSSPSAVAVDAGGNLYVADTGNNRISEVPYISGTYGTAVTLYTGLSGPSGLALDDNGNLYVADSGNSRVLVLASAGSQPPGSLVTTIGSGFTTPVAVAVDNVSNNVYVADNGTKTVVQIDVSTSKQTTVVSGLTAAAGIALDASASLYVIDSGAQTISRVQNSQGSFSPTTTLGTIVSRPAAVAVDLLGNVYAADTTDATVGKMARTAGSLSFGSVPAGNSGSALTATLTNGGVIYTSVTFNSPYYTASGNTADFTVQSPSGCANGGSIYYSYSCTVSVVFNPVAVASYTDMLTFSNNAGADTLVLTGTGTSAATLGSLTVAGFPTTTSTGLAGNVTVSAFDTTGAAMPSFTGTVTLTSTDPNATLPAAYTFQSSDAGVHTFSVTLNTIGTQSITATSGSISASETGIVVGDYIWVLNASGSTSKLSESGGSVANGGFSGGTSTRGGLAFDSSGDVWSVTSGSNSLAFTTNTGATPNTYTGGGLSSPVSIAVDGVGDIWVANSGNNSVSEFLSSGTAQSGTAGYGAAALSGPSAVVIDGSGGVWVTNKTANSLTHIIGAATPVVTPLSTAVSTGKVGTAP